MTRSRKSVAGNRIFASLLTAAIGWSGAAAAQTPPSFDQVVAGAAREGKVTAWIQAPGRPQTARALTAAFNKRFNLDIKVEWVVAPSPASNTRAIAEMAGGHVSVDIIGVGAAEEVAAATRAGLIKPYPWSVVFGAAMPEIPALEALMIPEFKGDALPFMVAAYGLAWNPGLIAEADLPERIAQLADPKWRGKLGVNSFFLVPFDVLSYAMGQPQTLDLARRVIANDPVYERGTAAVARAVTTGEVPIGITVSPVAAELMRQKQPLKFRLFTDYIPVSQLHLYVPDGAPDPNAARLFTAWLVTEGVRIGDTFEPMSSPADKESAVATMIAAQMRTTGARIAAPASSVDLAASQKLRDQISLLETGQAAK
jgi:ABC-type Fe3+ transport system substrate-binding protein